MTPQQKFLVQQTWEQVAPIADQAAEMFYDRLFELDPSLRELFAETDMAAQRGMLMNMLGTAVRGLDDIERLIPAVEELGRRHVGYGVADAHYDTVREALFWTLGQGLGEAWTLHAADAWGVVYGTVADIMRNAAAEVSVAA